MQTMGVACTEVSHHGGLVAKGDGIAGRRFTANVRDRSADQDAIDISHPQLFMEVRGRCILYQSVEVAFFGCSWFEDSDGSPSCRKVAFHAKLIEETDLAHPVILGADGRVMDGMHRVCKAWMRGDKTIKVVRFEVDPEPDYVDVDLKSLPYDQPW